ncbi:MAG: glycosyltransferase [Deltaproteobacteria bacterium]
MGSAAKGKPPIGVAYVLPGLGQGGTEKHVRDLAAGIDRSRFSPLLISTGGDGPLSRGMTERGIPVHPLEYRGLSVRPGKAIPLAREAAGFFRSFRRILRERRIGIVHAYLPAANILGMLASSFAGIRVRIVSKRALCREKKEHPLFSGLENVANRIADAVMVNSRAVAEDVCRTERFAGRKIFLVYNGIDVPEEAPPRTLSPPPADLRLPAGSPLVTYIANLREVKQHRVLVEAAARVAAAVPSVRFLFAGSEGSEGAVIRDRIRELGLTETIRIAGFRSDVRAILAATTVVAHPAAEGFSNAVLEAMAAGVPVVAAAAGGTPEAIRDGESGLLVPPGDPEAMASAILSLLRHPDRAAALGEGGRNRARERFSLKRMVESVERTYMELLEGKPLSCGVRAG